MFDNRAKTNAPQCAVSDPVRLKRERLVTDDGSFSFTTTGEIVLGLFLLVFVGAALVAYGEKFRSGRR